MSVPLPAPEPRRVPVARALGWLTSAINVGARGGRAVFGGTALGIAALYLLLTVMLAVLSPPQAAGAAVDVTAALRAIAPVFVVMLLAFPLLLGGVVHLVDLAERGAPVRPVDVFAPLRDGRRVRALAAVGLLQVALAAIVMALVTLLGGDDFWSEYMQAVQQLVNGQAATPPQPRHPLLMSAMQMVFNYFSAATMLLSVPLVVCSGLGISAAFVGSLRAALRNLVPNLVAAAVVVAVVVAAVVAFAVVAALAGSIGALVHASVGALLVAALTLAFATVMLTLLMAAAYHAWRDMFGPDAPPPPVLRDGPTMPGQIEA